MEESFKLLDVSNSDDAAESAAKESPAETAPTAAKPTMVIPKKEELYFYKDAKPLDERSWFEIGRYSDDKEKAAANKNDLMRIKLEAYEHTNPYQ